MDEPGVQHNPPHVRPPSMPQRQPNGEKNVKLEVVEFHG